MDRRTFCKSNAIAATSIMGYSFFPDFLNNSNSSDNKKSYADYLRKSAVPKEEQFPQFRKMVAGPARSILKNPAALIPTGTVSHNVTR
jgi:hypothetical protein